MCTDGWCGWSRVPLAGTLSLLSLDLPDRRIPTFWHIENSRPGLETGQVAWLRSAVIYQHPSHRLIVDERRTNQEGISGSRDSSHMSRGLRQPMGAQGDFVGVF